MRRGIEVGKVTFIHQPDGCLAMGQNWRPSQIPRHERRLIAESLRQIADNLEVDQFETGDGGEYEFHKAPICRVRRGGD